MELQRSMKGAKYCPRTHGMPPPSKVAGRAPAAYHPSYNTEPDIPFSIRSASPVDSRSSSVQPNAWRAFASDKTARQGVDQDAVKDTSVPSSEISRQDVAAIGSHGDSRSAITTASSKEAVDNGRISQKSKSIDSEVRLAKLESMIPKMAQESLDVMSKLNKMLLRDERQKLKDHLLAPFTITVESGRYVHAIWHFIQLTVRRW